MSGLLAVVGVAGRGVPDSVLEPLRCLGGEEERRWSEGDVQVVVTRKAWQLDADFAGNVLVFESPEVVVAADASLYDTPELGRKLRAAGVRLAGDSASHYLEAAYRAWGPAMVEHLNGDYAFVVWERRERRLFCARDPIGGRALYWTQIGAGIAVASSPRALAELRGTSRELNLTNLAAQVAGITWSHGVDTVYRGVEPLGAGQRMAWSSGAPSLDTWWHPREAPDRHPSPAGEAAEELRELLGSVVLQRCARPSTTVWMSGGWDSTAVFAAGQGALAPADRGRLRPVSISYPEGDPGHEDGFIRQVAERWGAEVHWLPSKDLPLLEQLEERAAQHDEPSAHLYEMWNRALARGTRATGARVALDGSGGDQLFQVSDVFLADLLLQGRWVRLAREAHLRRGRGWRHAARRGLLPHLPPALLQGAEWVLGRRLPRHYLERALVQWVRPEFAAAHGLRERDLAVLRSTHGSSHAQTEGLLYLTLPMYGWSAGAMRRALLREGVELRSPLLDRRVIDFALRRPIAERASGAETKILLRKAMTGLLPDAVLAPRTQRTGVTVGFSRQRMRQGYPALLAGLFSERLRLAELGIVDAGVLRAAADRYLAGDPDEFLRVNLFHTMKTEFWLRGLERRVAGRVAPPAQRAAAIECPAA